MPLVGRRIVLGVSGGIAAYKAALLARRLVEAGAEVRVVMTRAATEFVGPATFAGLTGRHVVTDLTDDPRSVSPHTDLARWCEAIVVAPATAATLSRIAHGISEDALSATVLASTVPVIVAPAMHTEMWEKRATVRTMRLLAEDGVVVVGPATGALAGGDEGIGRMAEPEEIRAAVESVIGVSLAGTKVLVTAGGTREPIDPVRFIGNHSSGRMGHAIADEAARRGAAVTLVTTAGIATAPAVQRIQVETAAEMLAAVEGTLPEIAVLAAAVADFRPRQPAPGKLSRSAGPPEIHLEPTPDILGTIAARPDRPYLVGFAAETGSLDRAVDKARDKGVDLMVANDVSQAGSGFGSETNRVMIIHPDGDREEWPLLAKTEVARRLWDLIERLRGGQRPGGMDQPVSSPPDPA